MILSQDSFLQQDVYKRQAYGNDHLKAIVLGITCHLARPFRLNYPEIPDS